MQPITGPPRASPVGPLLPDDRIFQRYGAALALVLLIGALRLSLSPLMGRDAPLMPFVLAVFAAAYVGGLGPALFASALTPLMITPLFTSWPHGTHFLAWGSHVAFFLVVSGLVAWMMHRLQEVARELREDVTARTLAEQALVEADRSKNEFLAMLAQMAGHEALAAYDGPGALVTLETFAADFVLLDIGLPGMDGYAVARTLRERWPAMLIHALTGYGRHEDRARALESGFNGHLTKPVDPEHLLQIIASRVPA
ncbi:MAG: response regulator [Gammaproteobacteria bacterium]